MCVIGSVKHLPNKDYQMIHRVMTPILLLTVRITVCPRGLKEKIVQGAGVVLFFSSGMKTMGGMDVV